MAASRKDIERWLKAGKKQGATHMIVVCDEFDWEDYPVYVPKGQDARKVYAEYQGKNMQRVMEVYSFRRDLESQLSEPRAFHFD